MYVSSSASAPPALEGRVPSVLSRVYLAGPMTGLPQYNFPAFIKAAERLRELGYEVVSPAELDDPADRDRALASPDGAPQTVEGFGKSWGDFLARDVKLLSDGGIEAVVVLEGWQRSRGARLETFVAHLNGMPIIPLWLAELGGTGTPPGLGISALAEAWTEHSPRAIMDDADPYWDCQCGMCS